MEYTLDWLMQNDGFACECGKRHFGLLKDCIIGEGAELSNAISDKYVEISAGTRVAGGEGKTIILEKNQKL